MYNIIMFMYNQSFETVFMLLLTEQLYEVYDKLAEMCLKWNMFSVSSLCTVTQSLRNVFNLPV